MLRLPHPEATETLDAIKQKVIRTEQTVVADILLSYAVFRCEGETPDFVFYDEEGTIYVPSDLIEFNGQYAHLCAVHEHVEIPAQAGLTLACLRTSPCIASRVPCGKTDFSRPGTA